MSCNHEHTKGPNHHDADLILKLYDLRREAVMRQSRHALVMEFWPKTWEEFSDVLKMDQPISVAFRQVTSYWEMAYSFARHGVIDANFLLENAGEGLFIYGKFLPFVERFRQEMSPTAFRNVEWMATECEEGRMRLELIKKRVAQIHESKK